MSFVVIAVLIVLTALAVGYVGLLLEEHAEWREWHVPRGKEFISYPLEYGEHDGLLLTDVEYATCKDLLEVRYTVENRNKGQTPVRNDLDRDARGSPCANDPIIPAQGPERTARDTTRPDLVTADSLPDESIGEQPLPPCKKIKNKPRTVRLRGSRIVSYSIAFGRPGLSSRVCAHARTASSE